MADNRCTGGTEAAAGGVGAVLPTATGRAEPTRGAARTGRARRATGMSAEVSAEDRCTTTEGIGVLPGGGWGVVIGWAVPGVDRCTTTEGNGLLLGGGGGGDDALAVAPVVGRCTAGPTTVEPEGATGGAGTLAVEDRCTDVVSGTDPAGGTDSGAPSSDRRTGGVAEGCGPGERVEEVEGEAGDAAEGAEAEGEAEGIGAARGAGEIGAAEGTVVADGGFWPPLVGAPSPAARPGARDALR